MADDNPNLNPAQLAGLVNDARNYWKDEGFSPGGVVREVEYSKAFTGINPLFQGIKIVDCDTHFTEPPDLFTSRAPAKFKDKVPYHKRLDGVDRWFIGDRNFGSMGGNVIGKDDNKLLGRLAFPTLDEGHVGSWQVKPRLKAMDDMGVHAQITYQNSGITQAGSLMTLEDDELARIVLTIYNDACAERQQESGQRLFGLAHLPLWNKTALLAEARRCIDMDIKGFVLPDLPERLGIPPYSDEYWTPFFEMCAAEGVPLNFHLNAAMNPGGLMWKSFGFEQLLTVTALMYSLGNAATMANFMISGLLDKHPKLKIGMIESGIGWVPFVIEMLEHQFDETLPEQSKVLQKRPWEYFKDNFWVTYWFEKVGPKLLLETLGTDKVLFETDYPHPTSLYPGIQEHLVDTLGGYSYEVRKQVLERNAAYLYNLPF